jgi:D-alanine-D-alanine ligase-like ATP-grasp enzyme
MLLYYAQKQALARFFFLQIKSTPFLINMYMICCVCVGHGAGTIEELRGLENSSKNVCKALRKQGITTKTIIVDSNNTSIPDCDFVFNLCDNDEGHPDSFIQFTKYLEEKHIPYTGNTLKCFQLHHDKLNWSNFSQIKKYLPLRGDKFSFKSCFKPIIIKHRFSHGSLYPIKTFKNFLHLEVYNSLKTKNYYWENFIEGKELTVSCLPNGDYYISVRKQSNIMVLDFKNKWHGTSELVMPFLTKSTKERIESIVNNVRAALSINSYMRLDLRINSAEQVYLIDINPNCSLDPNGSFCKTLNNFNISYEKAIYIISNSFLGTCL